MDSITLARSLQDKDTSRSALRAIELAKARVPVEDLAAKHTELRRSGSSLRGKCPVHGGDNPTAFVVAPEEGKFYCHACGEGGDVVSLYARLEGHDNMKTAAAFLLLEFGFEPPQRPQAWFGKQERQRPVRTFIEQRVFHNRRRMVYRMVFKDRVAAVEDLFGPEEARAAYEDFWELTEDVVKMMEERTMGRRR
jgi:hypothetical protein